MSQTILEKDKESIEVSGLEVRIVAFVDILGFKDLMEKKDNLDEIIKILRDIRKHESEYKVIRKPISRLPKGCISAYTEKTFPDVSSYSDHILISAPIRSGFVFKDTKNSEDYKDILIQHNIGIVALSIIKLQSLCLQKGFALRGSIALGEVYFDQSQQIFIGNPIVEAIETENKAAIYPRIIICKSALKYANTLYFYFKKDIDGMIFVDYLQHFVSSKALATTKKLNKIRAVIVRNINDTDKPLQAIAKWYWLAHYFDNMIKIRDKKFPKIERISKI